MAGFTAPTATVQPVDGQAYSHTLSGDPNGEVWVRIEPTQSGTIHVELDSGSSLKPYADFYLVVGPITDPFSYDRWIGWAGDSQPAYITNPRGGIEAVAGEVYLLAIYEAPGFGVSTMTFNLTLTYEGPPNDRVVDAGLVPTGYQRSISGTTVNGSLEPDEFDYWGEQPPSVWYKIVPGGPGQVTIKIEGQGGFIPAAQLFYPTGGPVNGFADLTEDGQISMGDGTTSPPTALLDAFGTSSDADLAPFQGGEELYLRVFSNDNGGFGDDTYDKQGAFTLTVSSPPDENCLTAVSYINGASTTASVVSGAVRETATYHAEGPVGHTEPYESFISDQTPTLIIPVADILNGAGAGFYAVSLRTKLNDSVASPPQSIGGFRRNGQPIYPGSWIISTAGSTPVTGWLTAKAGYDFEDESPADNDGDGFSESFHTLMWLPVHPDDDDLEVIVCGTQEFGSPVASSTVDITQICFQRMIAGRPGQPYDMLDVPDYPLGTTEADLEHTQNKMGDIANLLDPTVPVTFDRIEAVEGNDICVTDDGVVWVVCNLQVGLSGTQIRWIGPALFKWNPSSPGWVLIHNNIEGLGFKRTARTPGFTTDAPYGISMDTDGTDLWIAYGVDNGINPIGVGRQVAARVKKYTVSTNTFSSVGGLIEYKGSARVSAGSAVSNFFTTGQIRVSPAGNLWFAYSDVVDGELAASSTPNLAGGHEIAFVARWTGSSWETQQLPFPSWLDGNETNAAITANSEQYEAESIINSGSSTATITSGGGETVIQETQTTHVAHTMKVTPPAGRWGIIARMRTASSTLSAGFRLYKNGIEMFGIEGTRSLSASFLWGVSQNHDFYFETDGNDEVGISIRKISGTGTQIWIDKVWFIPAEAHISLFYIFGDWMTVPFVRDSQCHVQLAFPDGENPRAVYNGVSSLQTYDPAEQGYVQPEESLTANLFDSFPWIYSKWSGSSWERLWQTASWEDLLPDQIEEKTTYQPWGPGPIGYWQQGLTLTTGADGTVVMGILSGIEINGGATALAFIMTDGGPEAPWYRPPGIIGGDGAEFSYGEITWGWVCGDRAMQVTPRGAIFFGYSIFGVVANDENTIVTFAPNGHGDWYLASEHNNPIGANQIDAPDPQMAQSPDGSIIYMLARLYIHNQAGPVEDGVFGVWACPVIEDAKIPLIPAIAGLVSMNWRSSDRRGGSNRVLVGGSG